MFEGQIGTIGHRHDLTAPIDDRPQHVQEGVPLGRVVLAGEHRQSAQDVRRPRQMGGVRPLAEEPDGRHDRR